MKVKLTDRVLCILMLFKLTFIIVLFSIILCIFYEKSYFIFIVFVFFTIIIESNNFKNRLFKLENNKSNLLFVKNKLFNKYKKELVNVNIVIVDYKNIECIKFDLIENENYFKCNIYMILLLKMGENNIYSIIESDLYKVIYISINLEYLYEEIQKNVKIKLNETNNILHLIKEKEKKFSNILEDLKLYYDD